MHTGPLLSIFFSVQLLCSLFPASALDLIKRWQITIVDLLLRFHAHSLAIHGLDRPTLCKLCRCRLLLLLVLLERVTVIVIHRKLGSNKNVWKERNVEDCISRGMHNVDVSCPMIALLDTGRCSTPRRKRICSMTSYVTCQLRRTPFETLATIPGSNSV